MIWKSASRSTCLSNEDTEEGWRGYESCAEDVNDDRYGQLQVRVPARQQAMRNDIYVVNRPTKRNSFWLL